MTYFEGFDALAARILEENQAEGQTIWEDNQFHDSAVYADIKALSPKERANLCLEILARIPKINFEIRRLVPPPPDSTDRDSPSDAMLRWLTLYNETTPEQRRYNMLRRSLKNLFDVLMRTKLAFDEQGLIDLVTHFHEQTDRPHPRSMSDWPLTPVSAQFERRLEEGQVSDVLRGFATEALAWKPFSEQEKSIGRLRRILQRIAASSEDGEAVTPYELTEQDTIGAVINEAAGALGSSCRRVVYQVFELASTKNLTKASKKFLKESEALVSGDEANAYKLFVLDVLDYGSRAKHVELDPEDPGYWVMFIHEDNEAVIKGLLWTLVHFDDDALARAVGAFGANCFKKFPYAGSGQLSTQLGNTCVRVLAHMGHTTAIAALARLLPRIKSKATRNLIESELEKLAAKRGVTAALLEDMAIPDFALDDGRLETDFDGYTACLHLSENGEATLTWKTPDGKPQKTVPSVIRNDELLSSRLKVLKGTLKELQETLRLQRDRLDRSWLQNRVWNHTDFCRYLLHHEIMGVHTRRLIWTIEDGDRTVTARYGDQGWERVDGSSVFDIEEDATVRFWHPLEATAGDVEGWRTRLSDLKIQQPVNQVYRETYTVNEEDASDHSNRLAGHILRQSHFNAMLKTAGWKFARLMTYDGPKEEWATLALSAFDLSAELRVCAVKDLDEQDEDVMSWIYVGTDQLRFLDDNGDRMALPSVPALAFSEAVRQLDRIIDRCTVGNDPEFADSGTHPTHKEYWEQIAQGELSNVARVRHAALQVVVPRLAIADQLTLDDTYLHIKGKRGHYTIHLGSLSVRTAPGGQNLKLTAQPKKDDPVPFLPFEGDESLSLILSIAILFANDDTIKDKKLLAQIEAG